MRTVPTDLIRTDYREPRFLELVRQLDDYLAEVNGDQHEFYDQFNVQEELDHVVLVVADQTTPLACGAFKVVDEERVEIKRMFTRPDARGYGLARQILTELESWAASLGYRRAVLETGTYMPDAMALYPKAGYARIPNYGPYVGVGISACFGKDLPTPTG